MRPAEKHEKTLFLPKYSTAYRSANKFSLAGKVKPEFGYYSLPNPKEGIEFDRETQTPNKEIR